MLLIFLYLQMYILVWVHDAAVVVIPWEGGLDTGLIPSSQT
jgi:hypothetical protein